MNNNEIQRDLVDDDGENRAVRSLLNHLSHPTYENLRCGLENSGFEHCVPDWAKTARGHVPTAAVQDWIRFIIQQEQAAEHLGAVVGALVAKELSRHAAVEGYPDASTAVAERVHDQFVAIVQQFEKAPGCRSQSDWQAAVTVVEGSSPA